MRIVIRCDGNRKIGTGHLMRCLTIARELRDKGTSVLFVTADGESRQLLTERMTDPEEFPVQVLDTDYRDFGAKREVFAGWLARERAEALLVDSYFADDDGLANIRKEIPSLRLVLIDDHVAHREPADLTINYCLKGNAMLAPLRRQFRGRRMPDRERVSRVLASTGGSDPEGFASALKDQLERVLPETEIILPRGVADMAGLMCSCDLAVSAGGTTVYELCAVGVPTILYTMADNQQSLAAGLNGIVPNAGDIREERGRAAVLARIAEWAAQMAVDRGARQALSAMMHETTDAYGAERIADLILRADKGAETI